MGNQIMVLRSDGKALRLTEEIYSHLVNKLQTIQIQKEIAIAEIVKKVEEKEIGNKTFRIFYDGFKVELLNKEYYSFKSQKCPYCGKILSSYNHYCNFCQHRLYSDEHYSAKREKNRWTCRYCGKIFFSNFSFRNSTTIYCSMSCRSKHYHQNHKEEREDNIFYCELYKKSNQECIKTLTPLLFKKVWSELNNEEK